VLLGMVGPFAIKRTTSELKGVGTSSGSIYAVSTVGSVMGTLLLGFYLFPLIGSREIFIGVSMALLMLGVLWAVQEQDQLGKSITLIPVAVMALVGLALVPRVLGLGADSGYGGKGKFNIRSEHESLYGWVRVIDQPERDLRMLTSDASMIGAASISSGEGRLSYQDIVNMIPALAPTMKKALIIGLGAGHMAGVLQNRYGIVSDTLEIDPAVADAARVYFGFKTSGQDMIADARYQIRHLHGPYDLIIHDCFTGGSEPSHLLTVESLEQLKALLAPKGVLAVNFVGFAEKYQNAPLASVARTVEQVFPELSIFISEPGETFNDFIFLASDQPIDLNSETLKPGQSEWLKSRQFSVDRSDGQVLTDNLNPLEHLQVRKAERYRRFLVDWLGAEILLR
jgi:spermidine synthase